MEDNPEINFQILNKYMRRVYDETLSLFLREKGIIQERIVRNGAMSDEIEFDQLLTNLQSKYEVPSNIKRTVKELIEDNPELEADIKALQRKATKQYGQSLSLLLIEKNILIGFE